MHYSFRHFGSVGIWIFFLSTIRTFTFYWPCQYFFTPVFYPALIWFMILCKVCQTERQFWAIFTMHLWIGTVFLKILVSDCMQYHPKNSSTLYFHFDFSFFLCSSQLDDSALCRHWVFSPQSTLAVKRSSSGNVCCNELQCVTIGHNILQCVTLCCYNRSQCITISHNGLHCGTMIFTLC